MQHRLTSYDAKVKNRSFKGCMSCKAPTTLVCDKCKAKVDFLFIDSVDKKRQVCRNCFLRDVGYSFGVVLTILVTVILILSSIWLTKSFIDVVNNAIQ